jgi:hypothetical protein
VNIYRYEIPVDDDWHQFQLSGPVVHVACRNGDYKKVHFWALAAAGEPYTAALRVFGTGHGVPDGTVYRGTAIAEPLVWHLFEKEEL